MSRQRYNVLKVIILLVTVLAVSTAVSLGGWYWLLVPAGLAAALFIRLRFVNAGSVNEVMTDERSRAIQEKASRMALFIFYLTAMIAGSVLVVIGYRTGLGDIYRHIGLTLYGAALILIILIIAMRHYYGRRL